MRLATVVVIASAVSCGPTKAGGTKEMAPEDDEAQAPAAKPTAPSSGSSGQRAATPEPDTPPSSGSSGPRATTTIDGVEISWTLRRRKDSLAADITISNGTSERIYVCDQLLAPDRTGRRYQPLDRLTVMNVEGDKSRVRLVVGTPPTDQSSPEIPPTTFRAIEPGAKHTMTRVAPWPLKSFNVMGMTNPLSKKATEAVLVVHSFRGEPAFWREVQTLDGATLRVPEMFTPVDLVAAALPIPR